MKIMEKPAQLVFSSVKPQISSICLENNGNTEHRLQKCLIQDLFFLVYTSRKRFEWGKNKLYKNIHSDKLESNKQLKIRERHKNNTCVLVAHLFNTTTSAQGSNPGLLHCRQILCHLSQYHLFKK